MNINIILLLSLLLIFVSGCSNGDIWIIGADINDNVSAIDSTYSSYKINALLSNVSGGNGSSTPYYAGNGLILNASNYFSLNLTYLQIFNDSNLTSVNLSGYFNNLSNFTQNLTNSKICIYNSTNNRLQCDYTDQTGSGGGSTNFTQINITSSLTDAPTPTNGVTLFSENKGAESVLAVQMIQGYDNYLAHNPEYDMIAYLQPAYTTTGTTAPLAVGMGFTAAVGTVSNPASTTTTIKGTMTWIGLTSAAGLVELKGLGMHYNFGNATLTENVNGGFKYKVRYNMEVADNTTAMCIGISPSVSAYTNVSNCFRGALNVNSLYVGFMGNRTAGEYTTNLTYYATNSTGIRSKLYDCGSNYSIGNISTSANAVYDTAIFSTPSQGTVSIYTQRIDNSTISPCIFQINTSDTRMPLRTTQFAWRVFAGRDNTTPGTTGVVLNINKIFLAQDN